MTALFDTIEARLREAKRVATSDVTQREIGALLARLAYSRRECPHAAQADWGENGLGPNVDLACNTAQRQAAAAARLAA